MGSKSKRRHAQKPYNRAQNKPPVVETPAETVDTAAPLVATPQELRKLEKERLKKEKAEQKAKAKAEKAKQAQKGEKKPFFLIRFFKWIGRCCTEVFSELKKVQWPSFKQVMKATGIVLGIVVGFGLLLLGIWELLGWLHGLLINM